MRPRIDVRGNRPLATLLPPTVAGELCECLDARDTPTMNLQHLH